MYMLLAMILLIPTEWSHDVLQMGNLVLGKLRLGACGAFGRPAYYPRTSRIIGGSFIFLVLETQRNALPAVNLRKYTVRNNNPIIAEGKTPYKNETGTKVY